MAGIDDLIKYMTQKAVAFIDTPKQDRIQRKQRQRRYKEPWLSHWFGMVPFAVQMWYEQWRDKKRY